MFTVAWMMTALIVVAGGCHWARSASADASSGRGDFRHVVVFKFIDAPEKTVGQIEQAFAVLPDKIKQIRHFEWGRIDSIEGLDKGFTHSFILSFDSAADCRVYLDHPDHQSFVAMVKPLVEAGQLEVFVFDYVAQ